MASHILRKTKGGFALDKAELSPTDNIAAPADASILTSDLWDIVSSMVGVTSPDAATRDVAVIGAITEEATKRGKTVHVTAAVAPADVAPADVIDPNTKP